MKNFDIEKLERKNVYKAPEGFFEGVQNRVIEKTEVQEVAKTGKIISLKWVYSAAAAIVILFAGTFLFRNSNAADSQFATTQATENVDTTNNETIVTPEVNSVVESSSAEGQTYTVNNTDSVGERKTSSGDLQFSIASNNKTKSTNTRSQELNPEEKMDMILATLSDDDIAALASNSENDIYLDLY